MYQFLHCSAFCIFLSIPPGSLQFCDCRNEHKLSKPLQNSELGIVFRNYRRFWTKTHRATSSRRPFSQSPASNMSTAERSRLPTNITWSFKKFSAQKNSRHNDDANKFCESCTDWKRYCFSCRLPNLNILIHIAYHNKMSLSAMISDSVISPGRFCGFRLFGIQLANQAIHTIAT